MKRLTFKDSHGLAALLDGMLDQLDQIGAADG